MNHRVAFGLGLALGMVLGMVAGVLCVANPVYGVEHVHSSSRWDRPASSLHRQAVRFRHREVVTWTEVGARRRALKVPGVRSWAPRPTDLAVSWRGARLVDRGVFRPTRRVYVSHGRTWRLYVAWVMLAGVSRTLVMVAHMPSHVEFGSRWRRGVPDRVAQWRAGVRGWAHRYRHLVARFDPEVSVLAADWNVDLRRRVWRHRVADPFPARLDVTWRRPLPQAGTHGRRLIDGSLSDGRGRARLLRDDVSSDHRPYLDRLS